MSNSKYPTNLLVLCGPSGSGKSYLEDNLLNDYPDLFYKWQQVSTRKKRAGESAGKPYIFIEPQTFLHLKDKLVGRIGINGEGYNAAYGSIPDFKEGFISTVILAEEGINDLLSCMREGTIKIDNYLILGLDTDFDKLDQDAIRENRNSDFFEKERNVLKYATLIHKNSNAKYLQPSVVVAQLEAYGMIKK